MNTLHSEEPEVFVKYEHYMFKNDRSIIYKCEHVGVHGAILVWPTETQGGGEAYVYHDLRKNYRIYIPPVITTLYGYFTSFNGQRGRCCYMSKNKTADDRVKFTFADNVLTAVELIK